MDLANIEWRKSTRSGGNGGECVEVGAQWRKSSRSNQAGGECVEVATGTRVVGVRDSKDRDGGTLVVGPAAFAAFTDAVKYDRLD